MGLSVSVARIKNAPGVAEWRRSQGCAFDLLPFCAPLEYAQEKGWQAVTESDCFWAGRCVPISRMDSCSLFYGNTLASTFSLKVQKFSFF